LLSPISLNNIYTGNNVEKITDTITLTKELSLYNSHTLKGFNNTPVPLVLLRIEFAEIITSVKNTEHKNNVTLDAVFLFKKNR
jgi:hypothetical protein